MAFRAALDSTSSVGSDDYENQNVPNGSQKVTQFRIFEIKDHSINILKAI